MVIDPKNNSKGGKKSPATIGFTVLGGIIVICIVLAVFLFRKSGKEPERHQFIKNAELSIADAENSLKNIKSAGGKDADRYDIEQTVTALYAVEKAIKESSGFEDITEFIMSRNDENAAPDATLLKYKFFHVYKNFIEAKDELDELNSIYNVTSSAVGDFLSISGGSLTPLLDTDKEQAKLVWQKRVEESKLKESIKRRLRGHSSDLLDLLFEYSNLSAKYFGEWDKLCSARDRAYLAFYERNWSEMIPCARHAAAISPSGDEAKILLVAALIEKGGEVDRAEAAAVIESIIKSSNGQSASAYLLRGVLHFKNQDYERAIIDFDQSAAYYPKNVLEMENRLNLYKKREFLNRSKEGRVIVNAYRGIMAGAGYFSPDFEKARVLLAKGEKEKATQKIFDHFFRRRLQGQWDKVLTDFHFCRNFLGTDLNEILMNDSYRLAIEPAWISNSLVVTLKNNDNKAIHNVTLLLCVRFTDMFKGDYLCLTAGESLAVLPPGASITVGKTNINEITKNNLGAVKKWKDIVEYGAIIISDEIITWAAPMPPEELPKSDPNKWQDLPEKIYNKVIDKVN